MERICLVEDDPDIVQMLRAFLQQEGFSVCHAVGQQGALALLAQDAVDLLLVDISLADGNGFAVCSAAKDKNLPVVFLTASGDEYSVVAGLDMGADDYVAKPFRPRELVSRIRSVLRRSGGVRQISCGDLTLDLVKGRLEEGTGPVSFHAGISSPGSYGDKPGADPEPEPPFGGDLGCGRGICQ